MGEKVKEMKSNAPRRCNARTGLAQYSAMHFL
jgi:hypothetical protein